MFQSGTVLDIHLACGVHRSQVSCIDHDLLPGWRLYSTTCPSNSRKAVPCPESLCMMKPSPPKKPAPSFSGRIWTGSRLFRRQESGLLHDHFIARPHFPWTDLSWEAGCKCDHPFPSIAVYRFWKSASPANILPSAFADPAV